MDRRLPVRVPNIAAAKVVEGGQDFTVIGLADGTVVASGNNGSGQIGNGTLTDTTLFVPPPQTGLVTARAVDGAQYSSAALSGDGRVWTWGSDSSGQLGDNLGTNRLIPFPIRDFDAALAIASGATHSLVITADGSLWAWGSNAAGELGDGTTNPRSAPGTVGTFSLVDNAWLLGDPDGDTLPTWREYLLGTDPLNWDTAGTGLGDRALAASSEVANTDADGDGIANADEISHGTDPFGADTDGDGVNDAQDAFPVDPTRSQAPSADPNDHTPPVITLTEPTNAVPLP